MNKYIELPAEIKNKINQEAVDVLTRHERNSPQQTGELCFWRQTLVDEIKKAKATAWFREMELLEQIEQLKRQIR